MLWVCKFVKKELVLDFYPFKQSFAFGGEIALDFRYTHKT